MSEELAVRWKEPVDLSQISAKQNAMGKELEYLDCWPVLLVRGPAGVGKTYNPQVHAKQKGWDVFIQECSGDMGYFDLVGSIMLDGEHGSIYQAGVVASAVKHAQDGYPTLLVMDEINLLTQNVLKELGSLFDFRCAVETPIGRLYGKKVEGEKITRNLWIIGTANSEQESAGFELDVALQSRSMIVTLDAQEFSKRLVKSDIIGPKTAQLIEKTGGIFGLREAEQVVAFAPKLGFKGAMRLVVNKYTSDERRKVVRQAILAVYGAEGNEMV